MNNITVISCHPQEPIKFTGVNGYETYAIDSNTIGVRPKWINFDYENPPEGKFLALNSEKDIAVVWEQDSYFIRGGWHGSCEYGCGGDDYFENIKYWMQLPSYIKESDELLH